MVDFYISHVKTPKIYKLYKKSACFFCTDMVEIPCSTTLEDVDAKLKEYDIDREYGDGDDEFSYFAMTYNGTEDIEISVVVIYHTFSEERMCYCGKSGNIIIVVEMSEDIPYVTDYGKSGMLSFDIQQ